MPNTLLCDLSIALPTPEQMGEWDRQAMTAIGIHPEVLMENASREALAVLREEYGPLEGAFALLFAGSGNNGGDAFALARHLLCEGTQVLVLHTKPKSQYKGETRYNLRLAARLGIPCEVLKGIRELNIPQPDIIVDGLLGTGFKGELREDYADYVASINELGQNSFVLALDIPSGMDGLTGHVCPDAVVADATVSFEAAKVGLVMPWAAEYVGELHVRSIGIPPLAKAEAEATHFLLTDEAAALIPAPDVQGYKGTYGHVLIAGGSPGMTGAPALAALGAFRTGAGLATVATPGELIPRIQSASPEIMGIPLGKGDHWEKEHAEIVLNELHRFKALALGPGLGRQHATANFITQLLAGISIPAVIDADALYHLAEDPSLLNGLGDQYILTPHPGEAARLCGMTTADVQKDRFGTARELSSRSGAVVVLKGAGTIIATPDGTAFLSPFSEPTLSVAGSGDVLSGCIAALLANGLYPLEAACAGVYLHGQAGTELHRTFPERGNLAGDIANALPQALASLNADCSDTVTL